MSVQVRRRREAASFLSTYVGAQGELIVNTTSNRVQVHDGATAGGWPAAKLADVVGRTPVADASYQALASDRTIVFTALTAARTVTLPAAAAFPTGTALTIIDESGACSPVNTITLVAAGADLVNGVATAFVAYAYGVLVLESNGAGRWTLIEPLGTLAVQNGGNTNDSSAGSGAFFAHTPTITLPAGFLGAGRALRVIPVFRMTTGSAPPILQFRLRAGSTAILQINNSAAPGANQTSVTFGATIILQALATPGASANVETAALINVNGAANTTNQVAQPVALATNGALTLALDTQWATAGTGVNRLTLSQMLVEAIN